MATDIKKVMEDYILAWNSHDVNKIISFFTEDGIYEDVAAERASNGKKEITAFITTVLLDFPNLKFELKSVFASGDLAGTEWIKTGTFSHSNIPAMPPTGKSFSVHGASVFQLRNGKFSRESYYMNAMTFLQQLGIIPGKSK